MCYDGTLWHPMRGEEGCGQSLWLFKQTFQSPDNSYFCGCPVCWLARPNLAHDLVEDALMCKHPTLVHTRGIHHAYNPFLFSSL